jgi:hypothetical protein
MFCSRREVLRHAGAALAGTALSTTLGSRIADAEPPPPAGATATYLTGSGSVSWRPTSPGWHRC